MWQQQYDPKTLYFWLDVARSFGSTTLITTQSAAILTKFEAQVQVVF
jgi:hypothetical protein